MQKVVRTNYSVTFVVPARNEERFLQQCLASIFEQLQDVNSLAEGESAVIVVDNGSTESTCKIAT